MPDADPEHKVHNGPTPEYRSIVSPDAGGVARARAYAKRMDAGLAIIDKRRTSPNEVAEMNVVGEVSGKLALVGACCRPAKRKLHLTPESTRQVATVVNRPRSEHAFAGLT